MQKLSKLIATLFFIGYIPFASGTFASAAGVLVYFLVRHNTYLYYGIILSSLILGFWSSNVALKYFSKKDPPQIVIDEFSSMLLVYLFMPYNIKVLVAGFILFRIFDIFKIPLIRKIETLPRGYGIMTDDIVAACLANIVLQILKFSPILH